MNDTRALDTITRAVVRVGLYKRISRDERTGGTYSGLGVARQDTKTRARLDSMTRQSATETFVAVRVFDENNTSATKGKTRPALTEALAAVKAGEIDAIAFYAQDRFTRMPMELEQILEFHKKFPLRMITSTAGEANLNDPHAVHAMRGAVNNAALEIEVNRVRAQDESEQRANAGKAHGRAPFGWQRVSVFEASGRRSDWYDILNESEAELLRNAARLVLAGVSLRAIVAGLQDGPVRPRGMNYETELADGTKAVQPSSRQWNTTKLRSLLLRASNAGLRRHRGKILDGVTAEWPAIFDMATYTRLNAVLNDPARRTNDAGTARRWLLSGLLVCADCKEAGRINGRAPSASTRTTTAVYFCTRCHQRHPAADLDAWVSSITEAAIKRRQYAEPAADTGQLLADAYTRLDALDAEELEITADKNAGRISRPVMLLELEGTKARRVAIQAELDALLPSTTDTLDLPNGFAGATLAEQRAVIESHFSAVVLDRLPASNGRRRAFDPAYVHPVPR